MTAAMVKQARAGAQQMGLANVELHESVIESMSIEDASVHVVISNGVIDLVPDKDAVFDEMHGEHARLLVQRGLHRDQGRKARRHLRALRVRGHAPQGRRIRRDGIHHQSHQADPALTLAVRAMHGHDRRRRDASVVGEAGG
jgi:hypothetical protein